MNLSFKKWFLLENASVSIVINDASYIKYLDKTLNTFIEYLNEKNDKLKRFDLNILLSKINSELKNYPNINDLINAIKSKNIKEIFNQKNLLTTWGFSNFKFISIVREIGNLLYTYIDYLSKNSNPNNEVAELKELYSKALNQTRINLESIKSQIKQAIEKIDDWQISNIELIPLFSEENQEEVYSIPNSAFVRFENGLSFSIFIHDNKIEIDDILEGGDTDFFRDEKSQSNYFELIEELRNPNKKNKILTLYTARPVEDRNFYLHAKTLPVNIFLASNLSHVDGLASDLSSNTKRDVWKIRINSKYLIQTLNANVKYYQVIKNNAPIESIELIS